MRFLQDMMVWAIAAFVLLIGFSAVIFAGALVLQVTLSAFGVICCVVLCFLGLAVLPLLHKHTSPPVIHTPLRSVNNRKQTEEQFIILRRGENHFDQ